MPPHRYITDLRKRVAAAVEEVRSEAQSRGELPRVRAVAARAGVSPQAVLDLMHAASLTHVSLGGALDEDEEGAGGGLSEDQVGAGTSGAGLGGGSGGGRFLDDVSPMASSSSSLGGAGSGTPAAAPIAEALAQQEISSKALQVRILQLYCSCCAPAYVLPCGSAPARCLRCALPHACLMFEHHTGST